MDKIFNQHYVNYFFYQHFYYLCGLKKVIEIRKWNQSH